MPESDNPHWLYWVLPVIFVFYCGADALATRILVWQQPECPLVGSPPFPAPSFVLNLLFAGKAVQIVQQGYQKVSIAVSTTRVLAN